MGGLRGGPSRVQEARSLQGRARPPLRALPLRDRSRARGQEAVDGGVEEERAKDRPRAPSREGSRLVQERARRDAERVAWRSDPRGSRPARGRGRPYARRPARARTGGVRRGGCALDGGTVSRRRAADVPRPRPPPPPVPLPHTPPPP